MCRRWSILLLVAAGVIVGSDTTSQAAFTPVSVECEPTDCTTWYRGPVTVRWFHPLATGWQDGTCTWRTLTQDTKGTKQSCVAWAGTGPADGTGSGEVTIKIDATSPSVVAAIPDRLPDHDGWFNHPVGFSFRGQDATSGVAACGTARYAGPDGDSVLVGGTCRDVAGNSGFGSFPLNYDATAPHAPVVSSIPGNRRVSLRWSAPAGNETVEVLRLSNTASQNVIFRGRSPSYVDKPLRNGVRHRYVVALIDQAGNRSESRVSVVPTASKLLSPALNGRVGSPPRLLWKRVKRASYYNLQLYRGRQKVLSRWPRKTSFQLAGKWRYGGHRRRLAPGRYTWYVWPGRGRRSAHRYGRLLGKSTFTVVR